MNVGIVGLGVVGKATAACFEHRHTVVSYDVNGTGTCRTLAEMAGECEVALVCVPTPPDACGGLDTEHVYETCRVLAAAGRLACVRSTVPVGTCRTLPGRVVYWPEFCNARSAHTDMLAAEYHYLGGYTEHGATVGDLIAASALRGKVVGTSWEDAEALKLVTNAAMAVKIAFANEAKAAVEGRGANWSNVGRWLARDSRLGAVGWEVPGPDRKPGFGGACLPKDLLGFVAMAADAGVVTEVCTAAKVANHRLRPEVAKL